MNKGFLSIPILIVGGLILSAIGLGAYFHVPQGIFGSGGVEVKPANLEIPSGTLAIANGGTGATTATGAATALGLGIGNSPTFTNLFTTGSASNTMKVLDVYSGLGVNKFNATSTNATSSIAYDLRVGQNLILNNGGCIYGDTLTPHVCLNNTTGANIGYDGADLTVAAGVLQFHSSTGNEIARFTSVGLGIGSTTPYAKLSVTQTGASPAFIVEDETSPDQSPFIIDANGLVGIGTTTPYAPLSVVGAGGVVAEGFNATNTGFKYPDNYTIHTGLKRVGIGIDNATTSLMASVATFDRAVTIQKIESVIDCPNGCTDVGIGFTMQFRHGTSRAASTTGAALFTTNQTITSTTSPQTFNTGFSDATLASGETLWIQGIAASTSVMNIINTVYYSED